MIKPHDCEYLNGRTLRLTLVWLLFASMLPMNSLAQETAREGELIREIIQKSEDHYRAGVVLNLQGKTAEAKKQFDAAVDLILESGLEVKKFKYLNDYYEALIERIFTAEQRRAEGLPAAAPPLDAPPRSAASRRPVPASACTLDDVGKINLRGFRLGQTVAEVRSRLPQLGVPSAGRHGHSSKIVAVSGARARVRAGVFSDVGEFGFDFVDGRLSSVKATYRNVADWPDLDQFVGHVAESLGIRGPWSGYSPEDRRTVHDLRQINCGQLRFVAGFLSYSDRQRLYVSIDDMAAYEMLRGRYLAEAERKRQEAEARRRAFRP